MMNRLKKLGFKWNHKRVHRVYCEIGLNIKIKPKKRLASSKLTTLVQTIKPNICWSIDFMSDALANNNRFRTFNVIDDFNREALLIKPALSLTSNKVIKLLDRVAEIRGYPEKIRSDNGPEFISEIYKVWAKRHDVVLEYSRPGKPSDNAYIERFNKSYREEILDIYLFDNLKEVNGITSNWINIYNYERPHESLGNHTPMDFANLIGCNN